MIPSSKLSVGLAMAVVFVAVAAMSLYANTPLLLHGPVNYRHLPPFDGSNQNRIDHGEDRRVGSEAEREGEHGHGSETGVLQQLAEGKLEITHIPQRAASH